MADLKLGARVKALREKAELSQEQMARLLGVGSHQIISQIESGERRLKADELLMIVQKFAVPLDDLTNPFLLMGEGRFCWRQKNVPAATLDAYEGRAGEWIGAYRALRRENGEAAPALLPRLPLEKSSTFEDAAAAGERLAQDLDLGFAPAERLAEVVEDRLRILVLMVDASPGISGAACQLPELGAALVNRAEPKGRRAFDLAHELFHILTWTTMPPERLDGETPKNRRVEQLADNFAGALLAPGATLDEIGSPPAGELVGWLNQTAGRLGMTALALKWRMANSGRITREAAAGAPDEALRNNGEAGPHKPALPPLFSRAFVSTLAAAIEKGNISVRRAAKLTDIDPEDLADLCAAQGVAAPAALH
ncbi:MAG TPA: XRE family transcriptional regulator [Caulobacteraceae bacterium]|jgi:transcriptional regulator with XRE-family HTH domain|nr:XRE family transcriptional regulator [Caulobacteraceae bacterium]